MAKDRTLFGLTSLLGALLMVILSACASTTVPNTNVQQQPNVSFANPTPSSSPAACSTTVPTDKVQVHSSDNSALNPKAVPYTQSGYCDVIYLVPPSATIDVTFSSTSGVVAAIYKEALDNGLHRLIVVYQTGSDIQLAPYQGVYHVGNTANKLAAQPIVVSVYYPGPSGTLQPEALPHYITSDTSLFEVATSPVFGLPQYPTVAAALCAPPATME